MTVDTFLRRLRQTPRTWELTPARRIRSERYLCPLQCVALTRDDYVAAADILGIGTDDMFDIVEAADCDAPSRLRRRLLRACGVKEAP